jgi:predicted ATPase
VCLAVALWQLGYPDQALARSREALLHARQLSHTATLAHALSHSCVIDELFDNAQRVCEQAEELESLCTEQRLHYPLWIAMAKFFRGACSVARRPDEGVALMVRALREYQATGNRLYLPYWLALLAKALADTDRHLDALAALQEAQEWVGMTDQCWLQAELHRLKGRILARAHPADSASAEMAFRDAMEVARQQGARMWELRAVSDLARLWSERGERQKAYDLLAPAYAWFSEGFGAPDLQEARALLDALS